MYSRSNNTICGFAVKSVTVLMFWLNVAICTVMICIEISHIRNASLDTNQHQGSYWCTVNWYTLVITTATGFVPVINLCSVQKQESPAILKTLIICSCIINLFFSWETIIIMGGNYEKDKPSVCSKKTMEGLELLSAVMGTEAIAQFLSIILMAWYREILKESILSINTVNNHVAKWSEKEDGCQVFTAA